MLRHKNIDKICVLFLMLCILVAVVFLNASQLGITKAVNSNAYENKLFGELSMNYIDITVDENDWTELLENASDKEYINCDLEINGEKFKNIAVRAKGNSSLQKIQSSDSDKYSLKIEFDHYDSTQTYHGLDKLALNNFIQDNTYMKDYLIYTLMDKMGVASPLVNYTTVTVNGEEFGMYLAVEVIEEAFLQRNFGTHYGYAYKPETSEEGGGMRGQSSVSSAFEYLGSDTDDYSYIFDNAVTNISNSDKNRMVNIIEQINEQDNIEEVLDIEAVIRYFVVHNFALNFDSYTGAIMHNYYVYEENGILSMLPWDYNLSFSSFMTSYSTKALANFPIDTPISSGTLESRPLLSWIFSDEKYIEMYHEIFEELLEVFTSNEINNLINEAQMLIDQYVAEDTTKLCTYEEFIEGVSVLKSFLELRVQSIQGQLDGSIPATSQGQEEQPELLIETDTLDITKAGSENAGTNLNTQSKGGQSNRGGGASGMSQGEMPQREGMMEMPEGEMPQAEGVTGMPEGEMPQAEGMMEMPEGEMPQAEGMTGMPEGEMPEGEMPQAEGMTGMPEGEMPQAEGMTGMPEGEMPQREGMMGMPEGEMPQREGMSQALQEGGQKGGAGQMSIEGSQQQVIDINSMIWLMASIVVMMLSLLGITCYKKR